MSLMSHRHCTLYHNEAFMAYVRRWLAERGR